MLKARFFYNKRLIKIARRNRLKQISCLENERSNLYTLIKEQKRWSSDIQAPIKVISKIRLVIADENHRLVPKLSVWFVKATLKLWS
jgi:hypothetical protein